MRRSIGVALLVAAGAFASALAGTEVVLQDGQVILATEVRRDGDMSLITRPAGGTASLPAGSVASVRLGDDPPPPPAADAKPETTGGLTYSNKGTQISGPKLPENKNYPTSLMSNSITCP